MGRLQAAPPYFRRIVLSTEMQAAEAESWGFATGDEIAPGLYAWQLLGDGRRFETWLAWASALWSHVTVKLPHPGFVDEQTCRALANEAVIVGDLAHPSIQRLLAVELGSARPHLVYEYVEGPPLDALIGEQRSLGADDVARLGMQLAAALHYVHGRGIVHLDLKPSNVVIREGRAIVLDFDIARRIGTRGSGRKPRGSPPFMAPEQIRCEPASPSMDLFALGATLYEAATGSAAFAISGDGPDRVYPQLTDPPLGVRTLARDVPSGLESVIELLLQGDPARRPATAAAALALLKQALPHDEEALWPWWADELLPSGAASQ